MGDRLGDGETGVSGLFVPLIFILYYNAKAIAGLLVIALFSYFTVTLLRNLRLSNTSPRTCFHQPHRGISAEFVRQHPKTISIQYRTCTTVKVDRVGYEPTTSATDAAALSSCLVLLSRTISIHMQLTLSFGSYGQILSQVQKLDYSSKTTFVNV
jgi:hypothetical protein